jgi:hypothetical protein
MTTSSVNSPSWLNPAQQLLEFLNALPSPFREQLLYRLYGFFYDEIYQCFLIVWTQQKRVPSEC